MATLDAAGRAAGAQEYPISFSFAGDTSRAGGPILYVHKVHLTLASGAHRVAIGFWDELGRVASFLTRELRVGEVVR